MRVAASGILLKERKILLIKRGSYTPMFPGCWGLPGGRAEQDETPEQTVTREVKEEVGIDFKPTALVRIGEYADRKLYRFLGEWSGEVTLQDEELDDSGWFSLEEAIKLEPAFDLSEVLQLLRQRDLL